MKNSWNQAVLDALSARKNFENDEQRCDKLLYDYTDKPKPKPTETTKRKSTAKRKSLIPNRKQSTLPVSAQKRKSFVDCEKA